MIRSQRTRVLAATVAAALAFALAIALASCDGGGRDPGDNGAPVIAANVDVVAPVPGTTTAVAYLDIRNASGATITITRVTSPQFEAVALHETRVADGIASMRRVDSLIIADGETLSLEPGGLHLMLMRPAGDVGPVTLNFHSGDALLLTVVAEMRPASD